MEMEMEMGNTCLSSRPQLARVSNKVYRDVLIVNVPYILNRLYVYAFCIAKGMYNLWEWRKYCFEAIIVVYSAYRTTSVQTRDPRPSLWEILKGNCTVPCICSCIWHACMTFACIDEKCVLCPHRMILVLQYWEEHRLLVLEIWNRTVWRYLYAYAQLRVERSPEGAGCTVVRVPGTCTLIQYIHTTNICIQIYSESPTGTWYCSFLVVRDVCLCRNWYDATVVHGTTRLLVHTCKRWWPYQMTCNLNSIVCRRAQSDMHQHSIVPIPDGVTSGITVFYHTSTRTLYQVLLVLY